MARGRSLVSILVVVVMSALPVTMKRAFAKHGHPGASAADEAQVRELLGKLAAASGVPEPEERTDADLMYEAMLRWNGEPAGSAAVDRLIDPSKKEAARSKKATVEKVRKMFWKDPFADDPQKLVLVRQEDRDLLDQYQRRTRRSERQRGPRGARAARHARIGADAPATRAGRGARRRRRGAGRERAHPPACRLAEEQLRRRRVDRAANRASGAARAPARSTAAMPSGRRSRWRRRPGGKLHPTAAAGFHARGAGPHARHHHHAAAVTAVAAAARRRGAPPRPLALAARARSARARLFLSARSGAAERLQELGAGGVQLQRRLQTAGTRRWSRRAARRTARCRCRRRCGSGPRRGRGAPSRSPASARRPRSPPCPRRSSAAPGRRRRGPAGGRCRPRRAAPPTARSPSRTEARTWPPSKIGHDEREPAAPVPDQVVELRAVVGEAGRGRRAPGRSGRRSPCWSAPARGAARDLGGDVGARAQRLVDQRLERRLLAGQRRLTLRRSPRRSPAPRRPSPG